MLIPTEALPAFRELQTVVFEDATLQDTDGWFYEWATGGVATTSGQSVTEASAVRVAAVYACVRCISEDIGKMPLNLYRRLKPRGRELVDTIPLYTMLHDAPSPSMDSMAFRQRLTIDALLGGNGYAEILRNKGGESEELMPLRRDRVKPWMNDDGTLQYDVYEDLGGVRTVPQANMFHLKGIGDGYTGWSVIRLARETIGGAMAAEEHGNSFFSDSAIPSGLLKHPSVMKKELRDRLVETWEKRHTNKRKLAVLEGGLDYQPLTMSNEDSQFLESRQFSVEEIARWFRVPPHKIQHLLRSTFSNIESQNVEYVVDCLLSWAVRWEHEIKRKLIPKRQSDLFAKLLFDMLLRGDTAARSAFYREMINTGIYSINDAREKEDLNPIDGGDTHFVPSTMMPLDLAVQGPQFQQQQAAPTAPEPPESEPKDPETDMEMALIGDSVRDSLIEAHADVVADAAARLLRIEAARVDKHAGKPDGGKQIAYFYQTHAEHVAATLGPPLESFVLSLWAVAAAVPMPAEAKMAVAESVNGVCGRHLALSRAEIADAASLARWTNGERARGFAVAELTGLAGEVKRLLARYRPAWLAGAA